MKNIPEKIFLQVGEEAADAEDFNDLVRSAITWCADKIHENDIEYSLAQKEVPVKLSELK